MRPHYIAVVFGCIVIAGCKSDGIGSNDDIVLFPPENTLPGLSGALGGFFVQSFDRFESAARSLRETDARYLLQKNT